MLFSPRFVDRLFPFAKPYNKIICDLWGVIHDGISAHPAALAALSELRRRGAKIALLTNAPRPVNTVKRQIRKMGIHDGHFDALITSGELAREFIVSKFTGARFFHIGPQRDRDFIEGLPLQQVKEIVAADVLVCTGLDRRWPDIPDAHKPLLASMATRRIPMVCANADKIVHVGDDICWCAGALADIYQELGGSVTRFGKPGISAFTRALSAIGVDVGDSRSDDLVLVIGDNIHTDILGGNRAGWDTLFVADGIHRSEWRDGGINGVTTFQGKVCQFLDNQRITANCVIRQLNL